MGLGWVLTDINAVLAAQVLLGPHECLCTPATGGERKKGQRCPAGAVLPVDDNQDPAETARDDGLSCQWAP